MFKKTLFQIHWFLGISAGLILSIMGVTGAIYSYEQPIQKWLNQESYTIKAEQKEKLTPAQIYQHFQQTDPSIKINSITIDHDPAASSSVNIVKEGARKGYNMMINPYSAEILPEVKGREFFQFIQQLHRNLTVGEFGKQLTGASTLILIYFILSGIYLRWPKKHSFKQWLMVKPQLKGRNFLWDLHAVIGTWVVIFYLLLAFTGLYWSYGWWRYGMFKVMGVERPQAEMQAKNGAGKGGDGPREGQEQPRAGHKPAGSLEQAESKQEGHGERKGLKPEQISLALAQTWTGFNTQLGREYSSITFNIPKKANGELEIQFTDAVPQHERARNKATYDYSADKIQKLELYEDKKLNEKIMSSMLPVHRGSFFGPVYQFAAMLASLIMPLFFVTGWMLYLKRRKQKRLAVQARSSLAPISADPNAQPWLIVYASQTGLAEQLAWRTAVSLQEARQPAAVKAAQQLTMDDLKQATQLLVIASTYGTGEAPDSASAFEKKLMSQQQNLSHLNFAVLALGSKEYPDSYCAFGHRVFTWLSQNGANALFDAIEVNNGDAAAVQQWNTALAAVTKLDLQAMTINKTFDVWTLKQRMLLNPGSLGSPACNLEFTPKHEVHWQAGDIAEIQPGNSAARIEAFLTKYSISANAPVESTAKTIAEMLWNRDLTVEAEPFANLDHLLEQLPVLPSREYSIASIPEQQVLRLVVRQQSDDQGQLGLGSGWLTQHAAVNSEIAMRIRTNESFHLIHDNRPIILIGNGTGIAGLMSLLSSRIRSGYTDNWLIFGERQREHDFFFQSTIEAWQSTGMLQRLDLAFSRDQAEKIYVHHKLREQAAELQKWIENGAVIYVCGSINGMASDVDSALRDILGEAALDQLKQDGRYRRDVY
jgi:sulfite reductase (NADPH) flavoprotein alpha-component